MAGVAEKARFYLERAVPQLREWEEKEIFSKEEIRTIVKKRNDYEHRVLSPGNIPATWSSYAQWEQSLETLRSKRCKRLKVRHMNSAFAGQARVLSIYERSVSRHPGSSALWREYLGYTASVKAAKRWRKTMTSALRMMPTDPELWVMAGRRSARNGDMAAARSFFMRGCRFCNKEGTLWLEYARCEMQWLEKMEKKRNRPGEAAATQKTDEDDELRLIDSDEDDEHDDGSSLPQPSKTQAKVIDNQAAQQLASNPAMDGAIPRAIFDISQKHSFFNAAAAESFFELFASFRDLSIQPTLSAHVLDVMDGRFHNQPSTCNCHIRQPILGLSPYTADFPRNLREVLGRLAEQLAKTTDAAELKRKTVEWIDGYLAMEDLDAGIKAVLEHTKKQQLGDS